MKRLVIALCAGFLSLGAAQGATIHDEGIDGALGGSLGLVGNTVDPLFDLTAPGIYTLRGTLDGGGSGDSSSGPDEFDSLQIVTAGPFAADLISEAGNAVAFLYVDSGFGFYRFAVGAGERPDLFAAAGALGAGLYGITLAPSGNRGQSRYTLTITVPGPVAPIPLPASLPALALGLGLSALVLRLRGGRPRS